MLRRRNEGTVEESSILHDMADCCIRAVGETTDLTTDVTTDLTIEQTTDQINLVASDNCEISAISSAGTIDSVISDSAGTMDSAVRTTDQQVVTNVDSDVCSFDSGIASFDSAVSSVDYSADNPDTGVAHVESGSAGISGATGVGGGNVIECDADSSAGFSAELNEASTTSATSGNSCTVYTQDGATSGDVSDNNIADSPDPYQNHMTLDEFLQSMVSAGVSDDEIASIRQQLTCFGENEVIELVTASPQPTVIDHVDTALGNTSTASIPACVDNQKLSSTSDHRELDAPVVATHDGEWSTSLCSKTETGSSIVESLPGDLAPFVVCDGQVVHYDAQMGVMTTLDDGAIYEEVPRTTVGETNLAFSSDKTCVFASDDLCHSVDLSSRLDEPDIAQVAPRPLA